MLEPHIANRNGINPKLHRRRQRAIAPCDASCRWLHNTFTRRQKHDIRLMTNPASQNSCLPKETKGEASGRNPPHRMRWQLRHG
jgi:hypothetical protein